MPDLPKQELDELFREGAGMQTFEYNEAAWDKMEVLLDNDDKSRRIGMWLLLLVGVAIAVMIGLYYTSLDGISTNQEVIFASENDSIDPSSTDNQIAQTETTNQENTLVVTQKNTIEQTTTTKTEIVANEINTQEVVSNNISQKSIATKSTVNPTARITSAKNIVSGNQNIANETATQIVSVTPSTSSVFDQKEVESNTVSNSLLGFASIESNGLTPFTLPINLIANKQSAIDVKEAEYNYENDGPSIASRLSYTVFAAPEWSSVGFNGPRERGDKFGAKIGYQLSDKFELGTGLSISQKEFNGRGSQFTLSEGWIDDIMPMTMEAKCNVIEIPLDLNYHFNGVGNSGLVAGVGLRSFMLHSEWYGFGYNQLQYRPGLLEEKVMDNENKNWVGSIELSLGYTKKVSNNLSVQIVPYLQIPTTGIGEGKVNLYSGGIQFAARFDSK